MFWKSKDKAKPATQNKYHVVRKDRSFELKALQVSIITDRKVFNFTIKQHLHYYTSFVSLLTGGTRDNQSRYDPVGLVGTYFVRFNETVGLHIPFGYESARYAPGSPFAEFTMDDGVTYTIPASDIIEIKQEMYTYEVVTRMVDVVEEIT
jgi:hypothetical protein